MTLDTAPQRIERALALCRRPYLAFSGGKDSLVVAHLARSTCPDIPLIYADDEVLWPEHVEYVEQMKDFFKPPFLHVSGGSVHAGWQRPWRDGPYWRSIPPDMDWLPGKGILSHLAKSMGYDGCIRGLRADESRGRAARMEETQGMGSRRGIRVCDPIYDWTAEDVWTYIDQHNLPYCPVYDRLSELGIQPRLQRVGPLALCPGEYLYRGWPELYRDLVQRYGKRWTQPGKRNHYKINPLTWIEIQEALSKKKQRVK